jgi:Cu/Ag efflux protein CusF
VAALGAAASLFAAGPYEGEVRRIDRSAAKITIRHGPLAELDMPAMTMVFQVKDKALLDAAKPGDKIRFDAEKLGGAYVVTRIEPSR